VLDQEVLDEPDGSMNELDIWEYNAGSAGHPDWRRYPLWVNHRINGVRHLGSPKAMYTPEKEDADLVTREIEATPPMDRVALRHIFFSTMMEYDVFTRSARAVRMNGSQEFKKARREKIEFPGGPEEKEEYMNLMSSLMGLRTG